KPFNDYYGFGLGDSVIRRLSQILVESLPAHFVGHIGGDDFICIGEGTNFTEGVENARQRFRSIIPGFYSARDREIGGIETFDREGSYRFLPLLDIAVVVTDMNHGSYTVESLAEKAGREKKFQKGEQIPEAVSPILSKAIRAEYPIEDTKALIEACGVLREEAAVPVLASILTGSYNWKLRKSSALSLGYIGNKQCTSLLLEALSDSNPHVRTRSVEGLVISLGRGSGEVIIPMLEDRSTWVRRAVLRGLGHAGWHEGLPFLRSRAVGSAPGRSINTIQERKAALEGISLLGLSGESEFLADLCVMEAFSPKDSAFNALCSVGSNAAAEEVIRRGSAIPAVLNLAEMSLENLRELENIALRSLTGRSKEVAAALRFFEGFSLPFSSPTSSALKRCLGAYSGD
ncbi:MAG: hypothetical protein GY852_05845, partial [bacterium]|nr:hypothetical protein [bacterium]